MSTAAKDINLAAISSGSPRDDYTEWCKNVLFSAEAREATAMLERACDLHLLELYRSLDLGRHLQTAKTAAEVARDLGFVDSAGVAVEAVLLRLGARTQVVHSDFSGKVPRFAAAAAPDPASAELESIRQKLLATGFAAAIQFLDFGAEHFVEALRDDPEFMDKVLSGRDARFRELWFRATNEDPLQDVHGTMGAAVVEMVFDGGRLLEVGGGTGNGTRHVLHRFREANRLGQLQPYIFTDVSVSFVMSTRKEIMAAYPGVSAEWRFLDINKPFGAQKFPPESVDVIFGVNAAHIACDTVAFLQECRTALRPGGKLVFAERVRTNPWQMAPRELTLNLSVWHRTAAIRNDEYRPQHGYLTAAGWLRALELAGFTGAEVWPDLETMGRIFPDQYAAVVLARK